MEPGSQAGVLQDILDCLCRESDPGKIYKTLKKLSSVPILCDSLAEIGFRKTIKTLKNQQLLLPFVKDLVDKWSPGFVLGPQPDQDSLDFGLLRSHRTAHQSTGLEETNQEQIFQVPPPCKRKSELPWLEEARRPPAKMRRGDSQVSKVQSPMADCASPESQGCGQTCLAVDGVPQPSSSQLDREASPRCWYVRKNNKTPVYSGCLPADSCPQESHPGLVGKPSAGIRNATLGQSAKEETEPGQSKEKTQCQTQTSKQSQSLPKPSAHLCLQESQEERLQALRARIQSSMAKRLQARQTTMISFHTQHKSPGQQGELGPRRADTGPTSHSLPEAPAHPGSQKHPCLPSGAKGPKKAPAKRPAPLMAKALRDYSRRFYTN